MTIEMIIVLVMCATCTVLGFVLMYLMWDLDGGPEPILEMDYDPEEDCPVCNEKCDDYSHWTHGG